MTSISAISTNHVNILSGLRDSRLQNKLAKPKAIKQTSISQVIQDVTDMATDFERSCGYSLPTFKVHYVSSTNSSSSYRSNRLTTKTYKNSQLNKRSPRVGIKANTTKRTVQQPPSKVPPHSTNPPKQKQCNLIKTFCKKFQDRRQINKLCTPASNSSKEFNNFISEFENIMLEDSDDSSA